MLPKNPKLRLTPFRTRQLKRLYDAGAAGIPLLATREAELWQGHQLVEIFEDRTRVLSMRVRLSAIGVKYAEALTQPEPRGKTA